MSLGIEWTPLINEKDTKRHHNEVVKEFLGLFADKLPARKDHKSVPNTPKHRIELNDPKRTVNGSMFTLPEKYLNHMIDFLEEHLLTSHIRPSKSPYAAGTWMIPKKDIRAIPRVIHDYCTLNHKASVMPPLPGNDI